MIHYKILLNIIVFLIIVACKDPVSDTAYVAPNPPVEINDRNLIAIEMYSKLSDESLFASANYQPVIDHITSNTSTLVYLFDRSDAVIGHTSPVVDIAWRSKTKSFFVQNHHSTNILEGTGMIVRPIINVFDGMAAPDTLFAGGCTLVAPLGQPVTVTLMTCRLNHKSQFQPLLRFTGDGMKVNKLMVGTVRNELAGDLAYFLKYNMKEFRLAFSSVESSSATYQLFFLTPLSFVFREAEAKSIGSIPMYECKLEYLR